MTRSSGEASGEAMSGWFSGGGHNMYMALATECQPKQLSALDKSPQCLRMVLTCKYVNIIYIYIYIHVYLSYTTNHLHIIVIYKL